MDSVKPGRSRARYLIAAAVLLGAAALGTFLYLLRNQQPTQTSTGSSVPAPKAKGKGGFDPNRPTPVVVDVARKSDVNIYLNGLGSVTPLKTVTVRARVDGELLKIAFTEGQVVKAG